MASSRDRTLWTVRVGATLAVAGLVACVAGRGLARARPGRVILSDGRTTDGGAPAWWTFGPTRFGLGGYGEHPVPAGAGALLSSGVDLEASTGAIAYEHRLAVVDLLSRQVEWYPIEAPDGTVFLGQRGELALLAGRLELVCVDTRTGREAWRDSGLRAWMESNGVRQVGLALPFGRDQFVLVTWRGPSAFQSSRVLLQLVDRSQGAWRLRHESEIDALSSVGACAFDGRSVYVAGILEQLMMQSGNWPGRAWQSLLVVRIDPESLFQDEVVREEQHDRSTVPVQLAVGDGLVACLMQSGNLRIYRVGEYGRSATPLWEDDLPRVASVSFGSPNEVILALSDGATRVVRVRGDGGAGN